MKIICPNTIHGTITKIFSKDSDAIKYVWLCMENRVDFRVVYNRDMSDADLQREAECPDTLDSAVSDIINTLVPL